MKNIKLIWAFVLLIITAIGCNNDDSDRRGSVLLSFTYSGCKNVAESQVVRGSDVENIMGTETFQYEGIGNDNLLISHVNALYGCDAELSATAIIENRNIIIKEENAVTHSLVNCVCPFDLTMVIGSLSPGKYTIKVYREDDELYSSFIIDYTPDVKGEQRVQSL